MKNKLKLSHIQIIAIGFAIMILIGTFLLMLPISSKTGETTSFLNALFTATSASCVTGLVVKDTSIYWSNFGQTIILILIQIGGLGFMTIATIFFLLLKKKMNLKERELLTESINYTNVGEVLRLTKKIIIGTLIVELLGALLLSIRFIPQFGAYGIWMAIFHSISAFCNAGFDLMGQFFGEYSSFVYYCNDWLVCLVIMSLIIIGGIGFIVWDDIITYKFNIKKYHLHSKIVLTMSSILIIGGALLFLLTEKNNYMSNARIFQNVLTSLFASVTARTAGFNTLDLAKMSESGKLVSIILMIIGGSPGSTAGGVKTTTLFILIIYSISYIKKSEISIYKRSLDESLLKKAISIFLINISLGITATIIIGSMQSMPIIDVLFETFSAVGTVGMTTGITRNLNMVSKIILIFLMYCGRVGSVSFATAITGKKISPKVKYATEKIIIG